MNLSVGLEVTYGVAVAGLPWNAAGDNLASAFMRFRTESPETRPRASTKDRLKISLRGVSVGKTKAI